jgi:hypothetical protein
LPFLLTVTQIGIEMRPLERTTGSALLAAGICLASMFSPATLPLCACGIQWVLSS